MAWPEARSRSQPAYAVGFVYSGTEVTQSPHKESCFTRAPTSPKYVLRDFSFPSKYVIHVYLEPFGVG